MLASTLTYNEKLVNHLDKFNKGKNMDCTYIDVFGNEVPVQAIVDTGTHFIFVSTKFLSCLKLPPDLIHSKKYGTSGEHGTTSQVVFSAIPLQ